MFGGESTSMLGGESSWWRNDRNSPGKLLEFKAGLHYTIKVEHGTDLINLI